MILREAYVSTWSLVVELEELVPRSDRPFASKLASLSLEKYTFPVTSMVLLPNGSVVHQINANTLLNSELTLTDSVFETFQDPLEKAYALFLEEGLKKAQRYLTE